MPTGLAWRFAFAALWLILAGASSVHAARPQSPAPARTQAHEQAQALAHALMSPFCPGLLLANCPSPDARTLRQEIEQRFARGDAREVIVSDLVTAYGPSILGAPPTRGIGLLAWLLPALAAVATLALAAVTVRRAVARRDADRAPAPALPISQGAAARLDEELERLD